MRAILTADEVRRLGIDPDAPEPMAISAHEAILPIRHRDGAFSLPATVLADARLPPEIRALLDACPRRDVADDEYAWREEAGLETGPDRPGETGGGTGGGGR